MALLSFILVTVVEILTPSLAIVIIEPGIFDKIAFGMKLSLFSMSPVIIAPITLFSSITGTTTVSINASLSVSRPGSYLSAPSFLIGITISFARFSPSRSNNSFGMTSVEITG